MVKYDKFFSGISQDDRMQSVGQYTYGQNINIRRGKWIELTRKPELVNTYVNDYISAVFIDKNDDDKLWAWFESWDISYSTDAWESFLTPWSWGDENVLAIQRIWTSLVWWTDDEMYVRTTFLDWDSWILVPWVGGNVTRVSTNASTFRQTILIGDDLIFFTDGKQVGKILSATPTSISYYGSAFSQAFKASTNIVGLTLHGNSLWVYEETWKMYCLDNQSEEVIGFKDFKDEIMAVRNTGWYDIVVATSGADRASRSWYANTGVSPESTQLIRRSILSPTIEQVQTDWGYKFTFSRMNNGLDYVFTENEGITYWIGEDDSDLPVIYSFGNNNNVLPESISIICDEYRGYDGLTWGSIQCIWAYRWYLYISGNRGNQAYIAKIKLFDSPEWTVYKSSWYVITKVDDFWDYWITKIINQIINGVYLPEWTSIVLSRSINEWPFEVYRTITNADQIWSQGNKIEFSTPVEMFNEISWKIELLTTDETLTPKFFSLAHELQAELYEESK